MTETPFIAKRIHRMKILSLACSVILLTALNIDARTWTSADKKSTFVGDLIEYNATTGQVTVDRGGKRITFKEQMLSENDIAFLKINNAQPS